ncbi:MAG: TetR family transcriptional regulator [Acidimicrobiia bacterium]
MTPAGESETDDDIVSKRERRLATKQQASATEILDAAAKAFRRRGYSATSIDDVADILGCTKGRVYHYYRTKGDLFIGIHRRALVWALESVGPIAERTDLSATARLQEMVRRHALHLMEHTDYMGPAQYHAEVNLAREGRSKDNSVHDIWEMRQRFESYFVSVIGAGMAAGEFRQGDPALIAKAVLGIANWMSVWFHAGLPSNTPEGRDLIASEFSTFALRGVIKEDVTTSHRLSSSSSTA